MQLCSADVASSEWHDDTEYGCRLVSIYFLLYRMAVNEQNKARAVSGDQLSGSTFSQVPVKSNALCIRDLSALQKRRAPNDTHL